MKLTLIVNQDIIILFFPASTVTHTISTPPTLGTTATSSMITPSSAETSPNIITLTVHRGKIKYFA